VPLRAWAFLRTEAESFVNSAGTEKVAQRLNALSAAVLEDFRVIVITLDERDDAQVIFETLNSSGEPLAAMDLVRNDVFHRATRGGEDVEALMKGGGAPLRSRSGRNPGRAAELKSRALTSS